MPLSCTVLYPPKMEFRGEFRGGGEEKSISKIVFQFSYQITMWIQSSNYNFGIDGKALMHFWALDQVKIIHYGKLFISYS